MAREAMTRRSTALLFLTAIVLLTLSTCSPTLGSNTSFNLTGITASSGTLTPSGTGTWTFDAGFVDQNTKDVVTFTVTNSGSGDFSATGSQTFSNNDFADDISGTFVAPAGQSASFTGTFTPTSAPTTTETGTLVLTPSGGDPITIQLKGTSGAPTFLSVSPKSNFQLATTLTISDDGAGDITFGPNPVSVSNTFNFTVDTSAMSSSLKPAGFTTFVLNSNIITTSTAVTISGQDSIAGAFSYTFTLVLHLG